MKIVDIFLGCHHKIGLYLGVISKHLGSFLKGKVQNGGYFLGFLKYLILMKTQLFRLVFAANIIYIFR